MPACREECTEPTFNVWKSGGCRAGEEDSGRAVRQKTRRTQDCGSQDRMLHSAKQIWCRKSQGMEKGTLDLVPLLTLVIKWMWRNGARSHVELLKSE